MLERRQLVIDLGDLALHLSDAVGVFLGEAFELMAERDGVADRAVDDALGLAADHGQTCRDALGSDQEGDAAEGQAADESPSKNATGDAHGCFLSFDCSRTMPAVLCG